MSEQTLYKRAFTRGLNTELLRAGAVQYPSQAAADEAADYIAKHASFPDPVSQGGELTLDVAHGICQLLKQASDGLCKEAGVYDTGLSKTASSVHPGEIAAQEAYNLLQKVAYENEEPNTAEQAAMHDAGARLDILQRPPGYAVTGAGGALPPKGQGEIGEESDVALSPEKVAGMGDAVAHLAMNHPNAFLRGSGALTGATGGAALGAAGGAIAGGEGHRLEGAGYGALAGGLAGGVGGGLAGHQLTKIGPRMDAATAAAQAQMRAAPDAAARDLLQGESLKNMWKGVGDDARNAQYGLAASVAGGGALGTGAGYLAGGDNKTAAAVARLAKIATTPAGTNTTGPNTLAVAAKTDAGAALDQKNRPAGYAHHRVSEKVPAGSTIGSETAVGPAKTAMVLFNKTATLVLPFLPEKMPDAQKIAHINAMSTLGSRGKAMYLDRMYVAYGAEKTASLAYAQSFYKVASDCENMDDEAEELEVAQALEHAAENLEDRAEDHTESHMDEAEGKTAAAMERLSAAARRITQ